MRSFPRHAAHLGDQAFEGLLNFRMLRYALRRVLYVTGEGIASLFLRKREERIVWQRGGKQPGSLFQKIAVQQPRLPGAGDLAGPDVQAVGLLAV